LRETKYTVHGAASSSGVLEPANNDTDILLFLGVQPDANGEIFVDVEAGPGNTNGTGFYYINLMQMDIVPEPATIGLLALGLLGFRRR
jgi:hypothetical protein